MDSGPLIGDLGTLVLVAFVVLAGLTILMPVMLYAAQKWAFRSYQELVKANQVLGQILESVEVQRYADLRAMTAEPGGPDATPEDGG